LTTACTPHARGGRARHCPGRRCCAGAASLILAKLRADNDDQRFGIEIVHKAIQTPLGQIAENAGEDVRRSPARRWRQEFRTSRNIRPQWNRGAVSRLSPRPASGPMDCPAFQCLAEYYRPAGNRASSAAPISTFVMTAARGAIFPPVRSDRSGPTTPWSRVRVRRGARHIRRRCDRAGCCGRCSATASRGLLAPT
jgi:hypothetical protein